MIFLNLIQKSPLSLHNKIILLLFYIFNYSGTMKQLTVFALMCILTFTQLFAQSVLGKWKTIDDVTNKPKSIIELYEYNGKLYGKVVKLFQEPNEVQDPICDKCTDYRKDKKIIGMNVVTGLSKSGNEWSGGEVTDPTVGKTYKCYITLESPDKLKVRGYIGISMVGRTQYWYREK